MSQHLGEAPTERQRGSVKTTTVQAGDGIATPSGHEPDVRGHFGRYGGRFVPEALVAALREQLLVVRAQLRPLALPGRQLVAGGPGAPRQRRRDGDGDGEQESAGHGDHASQDARVPRSSTGRPPSSYVPGGVP